MKPYIVNVAILFGSLFAAFGAKAQVFDNAFRLNTASAQIQDIATEPNGDYVLLGNFYAVTDFDPSETNAVTLTPNSTSFTFLARYTSTGTLDWVRRIGGQGVAIERDADGDLYVIGSFNGTADFDPSFSTATLTAHVPGADIFTAKYDSAGHYIWAVSLPGSAVQSARSIAVSADGPYIVGQFSGNMDADPSTNSAALVAGQKL